MEKCERCLEANEEPIMILDCGHQIHERCYELVRDEGTLCPISSYCDGCAFMQEDESEETVLERLLAQLNTQRTNPLVPPEARVHELAESMCVMPQAPPGHTPFYYDGCLHTYTHEQILDGMNEVTRYCDGVKIGQVRVRSTCRISLNRSYLCINEISLDHKGAMATTRAGHARITHLFYHAIELWSMYPGDIRDVHQGSPLLIRAHNDLINEMRLRLDKELKPIELAIETLQLRASFRSAGLSHILQPLPFKPHKRVEARNGKKGLNNYPIGHQTRILLLGGRTYLETQGDVIQDIQLPYPTAWAVCELQLSIFVGLSGYVFDMITGDRLDVKPNSNHYVSTFTVLSKRGRPYLVGEDWYL
jgi:hypothetical protein